jgi:hypothetical protein
VSSIWRLNIFSKKIAKCFFFKTSFKTTKLGEKNKKSQWQERTI